MKNTIEVEITKLDMKEVIKSMNFIAEYSLHNVDVKQLEGITHEDIVQISLFKIIAKSRNWEDAKTQDFTEFLMGVLSSELYNFKRKLMRRDRGIWAYMEGDESGDDYAHYSKENPKGYNNFELQDNFFGF